MRRPLFWPLLIALASALGLAAGMLGDGLWDMAAALGLAVPIAAILVCLIRSKAD